MNFSLTIEVKFLLNESEWRKMYFCSHDARRNAGLREIFGRAIDVAGIVVRLFAAAQDDMAILITGSGNDC